MDYPPDTQNTDGRKGKCRACVLKRQRETRASNPDKEREWIKKNKDRVAASKKAYRERNADRLRTESRLRRRASYEDPSKSHVIKERANAWAKAHNGERRKKNRSHCRANEEVKAALARGKLIRPKTCSACGNAGTIHGHHWSYASEHWLDVIWLCTKCHGLAHRKPDPEVSELCDARIEMGAA